MVTKPFSLIFRYKQIFNHAYISFIYFNISNFGTKRVIF